jgi:hypothetical protein
MRVNDAGFAVRAQSYCSGSMAYILELGFTVWSERV